MTWTLHGLGSLCWPDVQAVCDGMTCAWADYNGFHEDECPAEAPPYSHVWGWAPDRFVRVRVDGEQGVVGVLTDGNASVMSSVTGDFEARQAMPPERVEVDVTVATNVNNDQGAKTRLLRVLGPMPLTFVGGSP
jgi:hypothetical protein